MFRQRLIFMLIAVLLGFSSLKANAATSEEPLDNSGFVPEFEFSQDFDDESSKQEPSKASDIFVPIFKKNIAAKFKWKNVKNAKVYFFRVYDLVTKKMVYSETVYKCSAAFPAAKNNKEGSFRVTVQAIDKNGKAINIYRSIFHTVRIVKNTMLLIDSGSICFDIKKEDIMLELMGVAINGENGFVNEDGQLQVIPGKKPRV